MGIIDCIVYAYVCVCAQFTLFSKSRFSWSVYVCVFSVCVCVCVCVGVCVGGVCMYVCVWVCVCVYYQVYDGTEYQLISAIRA